MFHCEGVRKMPLSGLDPSMFSGFLCKIEAGWIDLRRRVAKVCSLGTMKGDSRTENIVVQESYRIFSNVNELPSCSDTDDCLKSMSDPRRRTTFPTTRRRTDFFDRRHRRSTLFVLSEQSGGGKEDNPVGLVTRKATAIYFSRAISSNSTDLRRVGRPDADILYPARVRPPAFPPPPIAKTKSPSSSKSRKRKGVGARVPFPSSAGSGVQGPGPPSDPGSLMGVPKG
jgi:hypothetical protein